MSLMNSIFITLLLLFFINGILLIALGQVSVRKFRKNPELAPFLGVSLMSGWDIINVGWSLGMPESIQKLLTPKHNDFINADYKVLKKHASRLDVFLAKAFLFSSVLFGVLIFLFIVLDKMGH